MSVEFSQNKNVENRRDDALRRALSTPPKPKRESEKESKEKDQD